MTTKYYAHSKEKELRINWQPLHEHLKNVAEMARSMLIGKLGNCRTDVRNAIPDDPSDEFPTCVGMNRNPPESRPFDKRVPHMRGDEPIITRCLN